MNVDRLFDGADAQFVERIARRRKTLANAIIDVVRNLQLWAVSRLEVASRPNPSRLDVCKDLRETVLFAG